MKPLNRRTWLANTLGSFAGLAFAQSPAPGKTFRIGLLTSVYPKNQMLVLPALAKLGYVEGTNVIYETRFTDGDVPALRAAAAELVALKVDMIIASTANDVMAARDATKTIPILMTVPIAPIELGLIKSMARPGSNITGTTWWLPITAAKAVENAKLVLPTAKRMADLYQSDFVGYDRYMIARHKSGKAVGIEVTAMPVTDDAALDRALETILRTRTEIIFFTDQGLLQTQRQKILDFALQHRILTMAPRRTTVVAGAAVGFHPEFGELFTRAAAIGDRILRGGNPAEIPAEMPMRLAFSLNATTLKALGIPITAKMHIAATEIIE